MIEDLHFNLEDDSPRNIRKNRSRSTCQPYSSVWVGAAVAVVGAVAGGVQSADASRKALHASQDAAKAGKVNIGDVGQQATDQALQNYKTSRALEQQYTPEVTQLRTNSVQDLLAALGPNQYNQKAGQIILNQANNPAANLTAATPEGLQAAANAAQANLASGNTLPTARLSTELSNLATRNALANAGNTAPGSLSLGRDLTARDLGLTSLQLGQQAQQNLLNQINSAASTGQGLGNFNLANNQQQIGQNQFAQNNALQQAAALQALSAGDFAKYLSAAQFGQSIQSPVVGLDPSAVANLSVGNSNLAANAGQQQAQFKAQQGNNYSQLLGQLGGIGAGAVSSYNKQNTGATNTGGSTGGTGGYDYSSIAICWVARECLGADTDEWKEFRNYMFNHMDPEFIQFYALHGQEIAEKIHHDDLTKRFIGGLMKQLNKKVA